MAYTPVAEEAKRIRAAYKARGWNNRMVSVRSENYSMGSSIHVTIKSAKVNAVEAKLIAESAESIRRCEVTGEILSGGNRYVHVTLSEAAREELAAPWKDAVEAAATEAMSHDRGTHAPVKGTTITFSKVNAGMLQVWDQDRPGYQMHVSGPGCLAALATEVGRLVSNRESRKELKELGTLDDLV